MHYHTSTGFRTEWRRAIHQSESELDGDGYSLIAPPFEDDDHQGTLLWRVCADER